MKKIKFTLIHPGLEYCAEFPSPAIKNLPEWYKDTPGYVDNKKQIFHGAFNETIKKCIPFLDSMSTGYIIKLWTDVYIERVDNSLFGVHTSRGNSGIKAVEGHDINQVSLYPFPEGYRREALKWINPWHIETPKGYSCYITTPINHNLPFRLFDAIVDTDTFPLSINFPFFIKENFDGIIPAGTPIAQVIPFKRDQFKSEVGVFNEEEYNRLTNFHDSTFTNKYKTKWWDRKKYE